MSTQNRIPMANQRSKFSDREWGEPTRKGGYNKGNNTQKQQQKAARRMQQQEDDGYRY